MKFFKKSINIALSPNNTWRENCAALVSLFKPFNWVSVSCKDRNGLAKKFTDYLGLKERALMTGSGREALYLILKAIDLKAGDEIILQSFTCMVVVNSIVWAGGKPVFVDIDGKYNLSVVDLLKKITPKTKAIMVQHTFGIPADLEKIFKICKEKGILLIEDCAHAMGAEIKGEKVGKFGDFGFYSLGRSKVISCVNGGAVIVNNPLFIDKIKSVYESAEEAKAGWVFQSLLHPLIGSMAKPTYNCLIGKVIMLVAQKLKLINYEVTPAEKKGIKSETFPTKLANGLAPMGISQLKFLNKFNTQRKKIAKFYYDNLCKVEGLEMLNPAENEGAIWLRYPITSANSKKILAGAKADGVILGDWYNVPIAPADIDKSKSEYVKGQCPVSEKMCAEVFNLPTYNSLKEKDLIRIVNLVKKYA